VFRELGRRSSDSTPTILDLLDRDGVEVTKVHKGHNLGGQWVCFYEIHPVAPSISDTDHIWQAQTGRPKWGKWQRVRQ
jgi:hypothetical protein